MTFKELNFFYSLAKNHSVSLVAKEMGISQSAISLAIKSLETSLGENLFDRIGKKLILNARGREFYDISYPHFQALNNAQALFNQNKLAGKLKITSSKTIANYLMPNIYYQFLMEYENIKIETRTQNSKNIISKVLDGSIDIGLIETRCNNENIISEKIKDDELIVVTSDDNADENNYIDALDKKWILRENGSGTRDIFMKYLGDLYNELNIFMELDDFNEIKQVLLKNEEAITVISTLAVKEEIEAKKLFRMKLKNIKISREFYIIYHKNKEKNKLFNVFSDFVKTKAKEIS